MPMKKHLLAMTAMAAICAAPVLAFGQANTGGSSMQHGVTQTTPQQGDIGGMPAARGAATTGTDRGMAPNTGGTAPGSAQGSAGERPRNTNPSGAATGDSLSTSGGRAAAPGAPGMSPGAATGGAAGGASGASATTGGAAPRDGAPGNPPSTATQRAADALTGNRTDADGTGNNPPGTAVGRALGGAAGATAGAAAAATGAAATGAGMAADSLRMQGARRVSRIIGSTIYNESNESIGEVDDILVAPGGGQPMAVISVGGFLGIGARLVAVPYERLQFNAERERWSLQGATRDSLQSLPAFDYDAMNERRG